MGFTATEDETNEMFCSFAALILHDDKAPLTAENIAKLIKAAGGTVPPFYPKLFAKLFSTSDIPSLLAKGGGGGGGSGGGAAAPSAGAAGGAAAEKPKEKEPEPQEDEEAVDLVGDCMNELGKRFIMTQHKFIVQKVDKDGIKDISVEVTESAKKKITPL